MNLRDLFYHYTLLLIKCRSKRQGLDLFKKTSNNSLYKLIKGDSMKKIATTIGVIAIIGAGAFYFANNQVEEKIQAALDAKNTSKSPDAPSLTGQVSTNILTGTLKIKDMTVTSEGSSQKGDLEVDGLKFYSKENIFSNNVKVSFNNYEVKDNDTDVTIDNEIKFVNHGGGKLAISSRSDFKEKITGNTMTQKFLVDLTDTKEFYTVFTTKLTDIILNKTYDQNDTLKALSELTDSKMQKFVVHIDNNKLLQQGIQRSIKAQYPEATDAEVKAFIQQQSQQHITTNLPTEVQEPMLNLMNSEKAKLDIEITNISGKTLSDAYQTFLLSPDSVEALKKDYNIKASN